MVVVDRVKLLWAKAHVRQAVLSLALAVSMAGLTVLAVQVFGLRSWARRVAARGPLASLVSAPRKAETHDLTSDQRLVAVPPEPPSREPTPKNSTTQAAPRLSASELFAAAAAARARGELDEAVRLSKVILEFFPSSEQGIRTHLTLGVIYTEQKRPELALPELALFRTVGAPEQKGEALWTQSLALRQLQRAEDERIVLAELLRNFPRSAYVAAARSRLAELEPDGGAH